MQTYESVLARVESGLRSGRWTLGDRLPSERALSEEFGVSRASVREALRVLEAMGIIKRSTGSGPDAGAILIDKPAAGLGSAIRLHVASGAMPVRDVVEMRLLIESWSARSVAMRCAAEQLQQAEVVNESNDVAARGVAGCLDAAFEILEQMEDTDIEIEEFQRLDAQLHVELVSLAGNSLFEATMLGLRKAIEEYVAQGVSREPDWPGLAATLRGEHRAILEALGRGEAAEGAHLVENHIEGFYRRALG
ncbi:FadR/GntR family transcriptional regulator [Timonella senegalensis]|uniref:FadR/GntR family transcriptional regulator n=1 Tax=Timonella senegalensis TaxID=1465825 RepID=UPI002FDD5FA4